MVVINNRNVRYRHSASSRNSNGNDAFVTLKSAGQTIGKWIGGKSNNQPPKIKRNSNYRVGFVPQNRYNHLSHRQTSSLKILGGIFGVLLFIVFLVWYFTGNRITDVVDGDIHSSLTRMSAPTPHYAKGKAPKQKVREKRVSAKNRKPNRRKSRYQSRYQNTAYLDLQPDVVAANQALNELLNLMERRRQQRRMRIPHTAPRFKRKVDTKLTSIINTHCLDVLPNPLANEAKTTLRLHLQSFIEAVYEEDKVPEFTAAKVRITKSGAIINGESDRNSNGKSEDTSCPLLSALIYESNSLGLTSSDIVNRFGKSDDEIWNERSQNDDVHRYSEEDAVYLLSLVHQHGTDGIHRAEQLIPNMLQSHCPQLIEFLGGSDFNDEVHMETVRSVMSILRQIHIEGGIDIKDGEMPAINDKGYLIAVNIIFNNDSDEYGSCSLIDNLVFYTNGDLKTQVADAMKGLEGEFSNIVAFESKIDVLMQEHCADLVSTLRKNVVDSKHKHHHQRNVYDALFRGELWNFALSIVIGEDIGNGISGDEGFVVSMNGGILQQSAEGQTMECPLINEMARFNGDIHPHRGGSGIDSDSGKDSNSIPMNEHRFDPLIGDEVFENEMDSLEDRVDDKEDVMEKGTKEFEDWQFGLNKKLDDDVDLLWKYARQLKDGEPYHFRRAVKELLELHHGHLLEDVPSSQIAKIRHELEQGVLWHMSEAQTEPSWPPGFEMEIMKVSGRIQVNEHPDETKPVKGQLRSPLLTGLFRKMFKENAKVVHGKSKEVKGKRKAGNAPTAPVKHEVTGKAADATEDVKHTAHDL